MTKPLTEASTEELKRRALFLKAVTYVAATFIVANIGYITFLLVSQKVNSVSDLFGRNLFSMSSFGACLLLSTHALRKTRAQLKTRELSGANK